MVHYVLLQDIHYGLYITIKKYTWWFRHNVVWNSKVSHQHVSGRATVGFSFKHNLTTNLNSIPVLNTGKCLTGKSGIFICNTFQLFCHLRWYISDKLDKPSEIIGNYINKSNLPLVTWSAIVNFSFSYNLSTTSNYNQQSDILHSD